MALTLAAVESDEEVGPSGRTAVAVVAIGLGVVASWSLRAGGLPLDAIAFGLVWVGSLLLLADHHPARFLSPAGLYLIVFGLFHGGLLASVALRGERGYVSPVASAWINSPGVPGAVRLSMLGCASFTAAVLLVRRRAPGPVGPLDADGSGAHRPEPAADAGHDGARSFRIGLVGLGCLGFGLLVTFLAIVLGGGLGGGYAAVVASAQGNTLLTYGMLFVGFGAVFSVVGSVAQRRLGLGAFGLFAVVAVPLGLRGPVLFVVVVVLAVEVRRGLRVRPLVAVAVAIALLMLIGVVRETRAEGPAGLLHGHWAAGPMDAIGEMGFSLYPTVVVERWHQQGDSFRHGSTLFAIPLRFTERLVGPPPPDDDRRLFNVEVLDRVGPIGGSPIAEGFHNFGVPGVVGLMAAIGAAIAWADRRRSSAAADALLGIVMLPLVVQVRNFFGVVPAQVFIGLVLLGIALLIPRRTRLGAALAASSRS